MRSLIIAKVTYGAALWTPRSTAEFHLCHSTLTRFWRYAFRPITGLSSALLSDSEVCHALGVPAPDELLCLERVRQLWLVVNEGPSALWDCLLLEQTWLTVALDALADICGHLDFTFGRPLPSDPAVCLVYLRTHAAVLKRLPGRFRKHLLGVICPDVPLAKAKINTLREKEGWISVTLPAASGASHSCPVCFATFSTKAAAASHQASRHGISTVGNTVAGSVCHVCSQQWWTTFRLKEHLRRSEVCRNSWQGADLNPPEDFEQVGCRRDKAWRPPVPSFGPPPFWATLRPGPPPHSQLLPSQATTQATVDALCNGPDGNLGSWFLQVYRFCLETGSDPTVFPVDTVAYDAAQICRSLPSSDLGAICISGDLQCLLEERHRLWLKHG